MKQNNEKIKRECDMCKIQFETWIRDYDYDGEREAKIKSNVNKHCPSCSRLKEK
ncbi:MAG: hypothetical protein HQ538_04205 [Parcubacteria group bacterium]|nr:hypothetical protein [Parcubacteria group bacterium]